MEEADIDLKFEDIYSNIKQSNNTNKSKMNKTLLTGETKKTYNFCYNIYSYLYNIFNYFFGCFYHV